MRKDHQKRSLLLKDFGLCYFAQSWKIRKKRLIFNTAQLNPNSPQNQVLCEKIESKTFFSNCQTLCNVLLCLLC